MAMTSTDKLMVLKTMLGITDSSADSELAVYLDCAKSEILNWMYNGNVPVVVRDVPTRYEHTQIQAVINGYSHKGAEGETIHNENGINRTFMYADMVAYIRTYVYQIVKVGG